MRIAERDPSHTGAGPTQGGGFADALRRARDESAPVRRATSRPQARPAQTRGDLDALRPDREGERVPAPPAEAAAVPGRSPGPEPIPELAALARAVPVAVALARAGERAQLTLSFGPSLDVELRTWGTGVEVVLRPDPRLARAAEAELPRLVAALRLRRVAVARAEVRLRGRGAGPR